MKKKNIFKAILGLAIIPFLFASCDVDQKNEEFTPGTDNQYVSFLSEAYTNLNFDPDLTSISVPIARSRADEAISVPVTFTYGSKSEVTSGITVASTASFEAGSYESSITINVIDLAPGNICRGTIEISDETMTNSAMQISAVDCEFSKAMVWESIGTGEFFDAFALLIFNDDGTIADYNTVETEIMKAKGVNAWRVMNPWPKDQILLAWPETWYAGGADEYLEFKQIDDAGNISLTSSSVFPGLQYYADGAVQGDIVYIMPDDYGGDDTNRTCAIEGNYAFFRLGAYVPDLGGGFGLQTIIVAFPGADPISSLFE